MCRIFLVLLFCRIRVRCSSSSFNTHINFRLVFFLYLFLFVAYYSFNSCHIYNRCRWIFFDCDLISFSFFILVAVYNFLFVFYSALRFPFFHYHAAHYWTSINQQHGNQQKFRLVVKCYEVKSYKQVWQLSTHRSFNFSRHLLTVWYRISKLVSEQANEWPSNGKRQLKQQWIQQQQ